MKKWVLAWTETVIVLVIVAARYSYRQRFPDERVNEFFPAVMKSGDPLPVSARLPLPASQPG